MTKKLKTLEEKIRELVPGLQEQKYEEQEQVTEDVGDFVRQATQPTGRVNTYEEPIRLSHVLLAIVRTGKSYQMSIHGKAKYANDEVMYFHHDDFNYNISNDRLDSQSEEVIDFLYKIICE